MKIALGQMNVLAGQMSQNVNKMLDMIEKAKKEQADLIIFPELCVTGYLLADKWMDQSFVETALSYNDILKKQARILESFGEM